MNKSHNCSTTFFCVNRITGLTEGGSGESAANAIVLMNPKTPVAFDLGQSTQQNYFCRLLPHRQHWAKSKLPCNNRGKPEWPGITQAKLSLLHRGSFHCFTARGPYPTQQNSAALSTATPWKAAGQFCFSDSFTSATLGTYLDFFWKLRLAAN